MNTYDVRQSDCTGESIATRRGETVEQAAQHHANAIARNAIAHRVTGERDNAGVFRAYVSAPGGGQTSTGDAYYVTLA